MSTDDLVEVESVYSHHRKGSFVMIARRNGTRYILVTGSMGWPDFVGTVSGTVHVGHEHRGFGAYDLGVDATEIGKKDFALDPVSGAVHEKGYSQQLLKMELSKSGFDHNHYPSPRDLRSDDVRSGWDGSSHEYFIATMPVVTPSWLIHVHSSDHMLIHVAVPSIYRPDNLASLLAAIETIPNASTIPNLHPASRAAAG